MFGAKRREGQADRFFQIVLIYRPPASGLRVQTGEWECVRAGRMDFSSGVSFTARQPPVCECKTARGNALGLVGCFFPAELILLAACLRFVWRKLARRECVGAGGQDGFFPADLILPSACIRCVWRKRGEREMRRSWRDGFSDGFSFTVCLHPVCLCKPARGMRRCGRDGFSGGVNFTVRLHSVCLCKRRGGKRRLKTGL